MDPMRKRPLGLPTFSGKPVLLAGLLCVLTGCGRFAPDWPVDRFETASDEQGRAVRRYTFSPSPGPNYLQRMEGGRIVELVFDDDGDGVPEQTVDFAHPRTEWPHFLIILDGVPFSVVQAMYAEGYFRLFPPPTPVVTVFPAMTDVALARLFRAGPCVASEAQYYDREARRLSNAHDVYLQGENAPWIPCVTWVAPQSIAVKTYLQPWSAFGYELREIQRLFASTTEPLVSAYSVGAAGIGTREGEAGIRAYLSQVDRLCERITYDRRGQVRFSITADHGHTLRPATRITFKKALETAGFRLAHSIRASRDVVVISYGLVTCAQVHTDRPAEVAEVLAKQPGVDLVMYREKGRVCVWRGDAFASFEKQGDRFHYECAKGDPLDLLPIVAGREAASDNLVQIEISDAALLEAAPAHPYPDALHRIWGYFHGVVTKPADVVVSLKPEVCHGSAFFHFFVQPVASTHGGLDREGSLTFLLSNATAAPLPPVLRIEDVLSALEVGENTAATGAH